MPISIGIPFYNAEAYLADAIHAVFAQTYQDWELILVDDGSTDGSLAIANAVKDPRVRVYADGKNKKLATRLNEIAQLATYPIIARMDADDLISPKRIATQLKKLQENDTLDLVTTGVLSITDNLKLVGKRGISKEKVTLKELLYKKVGVTHAAIIGKKEWFLRNPYNTRLKIAQDYDLWLRASSNNDFNISLLEEPLYFYREEGNATAPKLLAAYKNERKMYQQYGGKHKIMLTLKSYAKSIIVFILSKINKIEVLLKNRNVGNIDQELLAQYQTDLEIIKNTKVPGLD